MGDVVELGPVRCAELAAPAVSRAFVSGITAGRGRGQQLVAEYGGDAAVGYLIDLRNPLAAGRSLSDAELAAVYRYSSETRRRDTIAASADAGLLDREPDGSIRAS